VTDNSGEGCPVCNSSDSARAQFATARVAEHLKEKGRRDEAHREWIDRHTADGTLGEIREALDDEQSSPVGGTIPEPPKTDSDSTMSRPPREEARPESFAIHVTSDYVQVWQYRASISEPEGEWNHVETLDQANGPRLSLEYAALEAPTDDGY
jgi:hypothetical protein